MNEIIGEIGSVHDGSIGNAKKLIDLCKICGADYAKFQLHIPEYESCIDAPSPNFFNNEDRFDYFRRTSFTLNQWKELIEYSSSIGIKFLCSPFSIEAFDMLYTLGVRDFKIASGEVSNIPLLEYINSFKCNIFLSTGMSDYEEIDCAIDALCDSELLIMQCTSMYPCPPERVGLNIISEFKKRYPKYRIGFSDHYDGLAAGYSAAALGVSVIEKHITFSKFMYGSDAKYALEPTEFKQYSDGIREIWSMIDNPVDKNNLIDFIDMKNVFEKSIVAKNFIEKDMTISMSDLAFKKPGNGIKPKFYKNLIGKKASKNYSKDQQIEF